MKTSTRSPRYLILKALSAAFVALALLYASSCCAPSSPPVPPLTSNSTSNSVLPVTPEPSLEPVSRLPGAAIIDQLSVLNSNQTFLKQTTQELEDYGFEVDLYQGEEITIDFYRSLPQMDYKLIIFRAHSGLLSGEEGVVEITTLFTNEAYSETKHVKEQLANRVAKARIDTKHPMVFSIKDSFVTKSMEGDFNDTVIIMMGCSCIAINDLAQAFIDKGASSYLAWHATVGLGYVDQATQYLLQQLCGERATVAEAVHNTMETIGADPLFGAKLKYFPSQSGDKSLEAILGF
jgi:hypothetical protein